MKTRLRVGILACWLAAGAAMAWQPSGWTWSLWPFTYELSTGNWYWNNTGDSQWAYGYPPAQGWTPLGDSGLASGWSWYAWPYAYDSEAASWYYLNEADTLWVVQLASGAWSRFGVADLPATYNVDGTWVSGDGLLTFSVSNNCTFVSGRWNESGGGWWSFNSSTANTNNEIHLDWPSGSYFNAIFHSETNGEAWAANPPYHYFTNHVAISKQ